MKKMKVSEVQSLGSVLTPEEMKAIRTDESGSCVCIYTMYDMSSNSETIEGDYSSDEECDDECFNRCGDNIDCMTASGYIVHGSGSGSGSGSEFMSTF